MAGDLLSIGVSGLLAFQRSLSTTGHNIANVNTPGYSRQASDLEATPGQLFGSNYLGSGVHVTQVQRHYESFVNAQVRTYTASHSELEVFHSLASQVNNLLGDSQAGLAPALQRFFASVQGVANDPASVPARQVMLSEAGSLVDRFHALDRQLTELRTETDSMLRDTVTEINSFASAIADLNREIVMAQAAAGGEPANDLLDRRDALLTELAEHVTVSVLPQADGSVNVLAGSGQALVLGPRANSLSTEPADDDPARLEITLNSSNNSVVVTKSLTGGTLRGLVSFQEQVLDPARNALGRIAVALAHTFNEQHREGMDLDGELGLEFFSIPSPEVTYGAASRLAVALTSTNQIAAAAPIRTESDGNNTGDAVISSGEVLGPIDSALTQRVEIRITNNDPPQYSIFDPDGFSLGTGTYVSGSNIDVHGWRVQISGTPRVGDKFYVQANTDGVGDNHNALLLGALQSQRIPELGNATYGAAYSQLVSSVGTSTRQADISRNAQAVVLKQAQDTRESISGVNLDEEVANMVRFQQAYQAAARVVAVADTLFQTLLSAIAR